MARGLLNLGFALKSGITIMTGDVDESTGILKACTGVRGLTGRGWRFGGATVRSGREHGWSP